MRELFVDPTIKHYLFTTPGQYRLETHGGTVIEFALGAGDEKYVHVHPSHIKSMTRDMGLGIVPAIPDAIFPHFKEIDP